MKKRGQFYLVAALVIIGVIASLATVYNSVKVSEEDISVYDLSEEINFEALQLLDSGLFNNLEEEEIEIFITNLTQYYSTLNPDTDIVVIYGDKREVKVIAYTIQERGEVCSGENVCIQLQEKVFFITDLALSGNSLVEIKLGT